MSKVLVRYYGVLREIAKKKEEKFEVESDSSLSDLIEQISKKNGPRFQNFVFDEKGDLREGLAFAADGSSLERAHLDRTKSNSISEFVILPPISGGRF